MMISFMLLMHLTLQRYKKLHNKTIWSASFLFVSNNILKYWLR